MQLETNIVINGQAGWMPEELAGRAWKHAYRYSRAERTVYRKRKRIPVSRWAERHRVITMGAVQGRWQNSTTPYLAGIMDAAFFSSVETVILCAADQVGKSECVNNLIGYAIDRDPGPVLYVYPDEQTARENSRDRILPMIQSSLRLRSYLTGQEDDEASFRINLAHMPIYMAWARSAARLANKPIKYIVFDETDKYPDTAGKREASPIRKGEKRLRTYRHSRKTFKLSTPTIEAGPIWQSLTQEAEIIFDFHVACPLCGLVQPMVFPRIKFLNDCRDAKIMELEDLARYECAGCRGQWNDHQRNLAVQQGEWREGGAKEEWVRRVMGEKEAGSREQGAGSEEAGSEEAGSEEAGSEEAGSREQGAGSKGQEQRAGSEEAGGSLRLREYLVQRQPKRIGFHIPSWLSRFVGLSEVAAAFLRGLGDDTELKDFRNSHQAVPWKEEGEYRSSHQVLQNACDYGACEVPAGAVMLTAGVDVQKYFFYYVIRAWAPTMRSWLVDEGELEGEDWDVVTERIVGRSFAQQGGADLRAFLTCIDSGYRTDEVYDYTRQHPQTRAVKGAGRDPKRPYWSSMVDVHPVTGQKLKAGVRLWMVDTEHFKDFIFRRMHLACDDERGWHVHKDISLDYADQITSEQRVLVRKGWKEHEEWQPRVAGARNHLWDAEVYAAAAAHMMQGYMKQGAGSREQGAKKKQPQSWVGKREGWIKR